MEHKIDVLGCGVIYIDGERVLGGKPYGLFSTVNWSATDEDLKRIADRCLELVADRKTEPQNDWETEKRNNSLCYKCVKECDRRVLNRYTIECNQYEPKEQTEREGE